MVIIIFECSFRTATSFKIWFKILISAFLLPSSHHEWKNEIMPNGQVFHIRSEKLTLKTVAENTAQPTTNGRNGREKSTTGKTMVIGDPRFTINMY